MDNSFITLNFPYKGFDYRSLRASMPGTLGEKKDKRAPHNGRTVKFADGCTKQTSCFTCEFNDCRATENEL